MDTKAISENTTVRLSLMLGIAGIFAAVIYWAASLKSEVTHTREAMDRLAQEIRESNVTKEKHDEAQDKRIRDLELEFAKWKGKP